MKEKLGLLRYDTTREEGEIKMTDPLPESVVGLDILSDWIGLLEAEYKRIETIVFPPDHPNSEVIKSLFGLRRGE